MQEYAERLMAPLEVNPISRKGFLVYLLVTALCWGWWASFGIDQPSRATLSSVLQAKVYLIFAPYGTITLLASKFVGLNRALLTFLGVALLLFLLSLLPMNATAPVYLVPTFTPDHCDWILNQTMHHVKRHGWAPYRQGIYPRTELAVHTVPELDDDLSQEAFAGILSPVIRRRFRGPATISGLFVVEYRPETQAGLQPHVDIGKVSWITLLSSPADFEGGELLFIKHNKTVTLEQGQSAVFPAKLLHEARPVTQGARYILAGYTDVEAEQRFSLAYLWGAYSYWLDVRAEAVREDAPRSFSATTEGLQLIAVMATLAAVLRWLDRLLDCPASPEEAPEATVPPAKEKDS